MRTLNNVWLFVIMIAMVALAQLNIAVEMKIGLLVDPGSNVTTLTDKLTAQTTGKSLDLHAVLLTNDPVKNFGIVCDLISSANPVALIGPFQSHDIVTQIHPIMKQLGVPHVVMDKEMANIESPLLLDVLPSTGQISRVIVSLLKQFSWPYLSVIMDARHRSDGLIESLLSESSEVRVKVTMYQVGRTKETAYDILKAVDKTISRVVLLASDCELGLQILRSADSSGMLTRGWVWILMHEGHKCLEKHNVTYNGLVAILPVYEKSLANGKDELIADDILDTDHISLTLIEQASLISGNNPVDAVTCVDPKMKRNSAAFVNGYNKVKSSNYPEKYYYINYRDQAWKKFAIWEHVEGYGSSSSSYVRFPGGAETVSGFVSSLSGKHVWACTHVDSEEGGWKTVWNGTPPVEHDRDIIPRWKIAGFQAALFVKLSEVIGFNFTWRYPRDGQWGGKDAGTLQWNGIMRELQDKRCDIGAATLTLTELRHKDFDFTMGYFETGLSFIMRKAGDKRNAFRFFSPFEGELWYQLILALTLTGLMLGLLNKLSPYEYHGEFIHAFHDMQRSRGLQKTFRKWYKDATHELNFANSQWFAWCSLFQQGGHYPMSMSGRVIALVWWLAVLIFTATYTANMAALFTSEVLSGGIDSIQDLAAQSRVKYGTQDSSGSAGFFQYSQVAIFKQMYEFMVRNKATMMIPLRDGIQKARKSEFAFIWDKAVLDWEALQNPCDLATIGDSFNKIIYGYALRKGSPYTKELNQHILQLKEKGYMDKIYQEWFYDRAECNITKENDDMGGLQRYTFWNMSGVFLIIYALILISCLILVVEWVVSSYQVMRQNKEDNMKSLMEGIKYRLGRVNRDVHLYYVPERIKKSEDKTFKSRANVIKKIISMSNTFQEPSVGFSKVVGGAMLTNLAKELKKQTPMKEERESNLENKPQTHLYQTPKPIENQYAQHRPKTNKVSNSTVGSVTKKRFNVYTAAGTRIAQALPADGGKQHDPPSYETVTSAKPQTKTPATPIQTLPAAVLDETEAISFPPSLSNGSSMWQKYNKN